MSLYDAQRVMERALRDEAFRALLRSTPELALAEYELSAAERRAILGEDARGEVQETAE